MFMDGNSNETRNELIFSHEGNARAAASVILVGVVAALVGSVFMAIGPKVKPTPRPAVDSTIGAASNPVRIVGQVPHDQAPHDNVPCDQQVWPNIEQHCLVRKEAAPKSENIASTARTGDLPPPPPASPPSQGVVSASAGKDLSTFISARFVSSWKRGASHRLQAWLNKRNFIRSDHWKIVAQRRGLA